MTDAADNIEDDKSSEHSEPLAVSFRCPPELEAVLPRPIPALLGLPQWFKDLPQKALSALSQTEVATIKKCPPFIDAMTSGFLIPLVSDLRVDEGEFSWDRDVPGGAITNYPRSPIDFHENAQVVGTPFFEDDRFVIKFNNYWTIELPEGYSMLVTHPFNRADLPFETLTGLVDADRYRDNFINFPARWRDPNFSGVLEKGTPVAQCVPVKRETWVGQFGTIAGDDAVARLRETTEAIMNVPGTYRRNFRVPKR